MESTLFLTMTSALMFELELNEDSTLPQILERVKSYPLERGGCIELYQSSTGQLRIGAGRVAFKVEEDETLTFYSCGEQGYKRFKGWNTPKLYVKVPQHYYTSYKIEAGKTSYDDLILEHTTNDHRSGGYDLRIVQESGEIYASWGELVFFVDDDGILQHACSNVDSSG